jgi:hypothetical protein
VSFSGALALGLLAVSAGCSAGCLGGWRACVSHVQPFARLGLALAISAWYARQRGVPGDLLSLDAYVAMPLAGAAESPAVAAGLALLGLGALPLIRDETADLAASLRHLAGLAVWICLFLPVCPARDLGLGDVAGFAPGFALDALYFWGKILALDFVLRLAAARVPPRLSPRLAAVQTSCAAVGAFLLCAG